MAKFGQMQIALLGYLDWLDELSWRIYFRAYLIWIIDVLRHRKGQFGPVYPSIKNSFIYLLNPMYAEIWCHNCTQTLFPSHQIHSSERFLFKWQILEIRNKCEKHLTKSSGRIYEERKSSCFIRSLTGTHYQQEMDRRHFVSVWRSIPNLNLIFLFPLPGAAWPAEFSSSLFFTQDDSMCLCHWSLDATTSIFCF